MDTQINLSKYKIWDRLQSSRSFLKSIPGFVEICEKFTEARSKKNGTPSHRWEVAVTVAVEGEEDTTGLPGRQKRALNAVWGMSHGGERTVRMGRALALMLRGL
jgi:hypothetical protein